MSENQYISQIYTFTVFRQYLDEENEGNHTYRTAVLNILLLLLLNLTCSSLSHHFLPKTHPIWL